jgi:hypothetical protein
LRWGRWWSVVEVVECGGGGGVWWRSEEEWGGVMTSVIINIRHNYIQWRHAGRFKQGCVRLAD